MSLETHQNNHCKNIFLIFERLRITFAIRKSTLKLSFLSYCYVKLDLLCAAKTHQPLISDVLHNPPKNLMWLLGAVQGCNPSCSSKMHLPSSLIASILSVTAALRSQTPQCLKSAFLLTVGQKSHNLKGLGCSCPWGFAEHLKNSDLVENLLLFGFFFF